MYDIYLSNGCRLVPEVADLVETTPALADPKLLKRLLEEHPGYLGLDLSMEVAVVLIKRLKYSDAKAIGRIVPVRYRQQQPKITMEMAYPIAEKALKQLQAKYPDIKFRPVQFGGEDLMWFKFSAVSEEWIQRGLHPGALFAFVDKLDGHVWRPEEFEEYFEK